MGPAIAKPTAKTAAKAAAPDSPLLGTLLFKEMNAEELEVFEEMLSTRKAPAGSPIFVENMASDGLYIIKSGKVAVSKNLGKHGEKSLLVMGPGEFFGEMALVEGAQRLANAVCVEESELWLLSGEDFRRLCQQDPPLALKFVMTVLRIFGQRLKQNDPVFTDFLIWRLTQR